MHRIFILCLLGVFSLSVVLAANSCTVGSGPCCDDDTRTVKAVGDFCASENDCNHQRVCDGENPSCPPNPKMNAGTPCSRAINRCHEDGKCDNAGTCLAQVQKAENSICIAASDSTCDAARRCSATGVCGPRTPAGNTVACHTATTTCDNTKYCPAASSSSPYTCPAKTAKGANIVCRAQNIPDCREQVNCPGNRAGFTYEQNIVCPPERFSSDDTTCETGICHSKHCSGTGPGCTLVKADSLAENGEPCTDEAGCTGSDVATCMNGVCGACGPETPGGTDDPLISGFHRQRFWLEGTDGKFYNMFSEPGMTFNAKIVNAHSKGEKVQTVMAEIAFITKNNVVHITPQFGRDGKIVVNGKTVQLSTKNNVYDLDDCVQMAWSPKSVLFSSAQFEIVIAFFKASSTENLNVDFLNVKIPHVSGDVSKMSGIIGQTAHLANNIDKQWTDFEVSNLFAQDSTMNTFTGADLACENVEASKRNVGKFESATKKEIEDMTRYSHAMA